MMSKYKYEYKATYFNLKRKIYCTLNFAVEANTKWGGWTKALYAAMEKEDGDNMLVGIVNINADYTIYL